MNEKQLTKEAAKKKLELLRKRTDILSCGSCGDTGSFASDLGQELQCCCVHGVRLMAGIKLKRR